MTFVCNCKNCGRTIERDFIYCPWCGAKKTLGIPHSTSEEVFNELEQKQISALEERIAEIYRRLDDLESDFGSMSRSSE